MIKKIKLLVAFSLICSSFSCWSEEKVSPQNDDHISEDILQQMAAEESNLDLKRYKFPSNNYNHELPAHSCVIGYFYYYTTESEGMHKLHAINDKNSKGKPVKILRMECNGTENNSYTNRVTSKK